MAEDSTTNSGSTTGTPDAERLEVQRTIPVEASRIFALLRDPKGHVAIDSSGMLQDSSGEPASKVGDEFVIHMDRESFNDYPMGKYDVTVTITTFEPDRESPGPFSGRSGHSSATSTGTPSRPSRVGRS